MKIIPTTLSVQQFFAAGNEQFLIPAYQRRYAWGLRQQRELFDDLLLLPEQDNHLLGTVLFLAETHGAGINELELVDGQQRITTLTILMHSLRLRFEREGDNDTAHEIKKLLQCKGVDRKVRSKLQLGDLDHSDYLLVMENGKAEDINNRCLLEAFSNFSEWIEILSEDELNSFYHKLMNGTSIIRLDVGAAKDAYKLFETINNRGLRLKPTDIIKNFLLGHASSLPVGTLDKVKEDWRKVVVALDGLDSDGFFRQWLAGRLHRKVPRTKLVSEFRTYYLKQVCEAQKMSEYISANMAGDDDEEDGEDSVEISASDDVTAEENDDKVTLTEFVSALRQAAELYACLLTGNTSSRIINRHLRNLKRIKAFQSFTWLLDMFGRASLGEKNKVALLKALEAFMMRRHICEKRSNELETIFAMLTGIKSTSYKADVLETLREYSPDDDEFGVSFSTFLFVPAVIDRARYALEMLEYHSIDHKNEYYLADTDDLHLEHIIPKAADKPATKAALGDWPTYLGRAWRVRHAKMLHRIGNMTLLADELNITASNNPFLAKCIEYKKSKIFLSSSLAGLGEFKFDTVDERSKSFAEQAVEIWQV